MFSWFIELVAWVLLIDEFIIFIGPVRLSITYWFCWKLKASFWVPLAALPILPASYMPKLASKGSWKLYFLVPTAAELGCCYVLLICLLLLGLSCLLAISFWTMFATSPESLDFRLFWMLFCRELLVRSLVFYYCTKYCRGLLDPLIFLLL